MRWVDKRTQNLNALIDRHSGWHLNSARGINRTGTIVGTGRVRQQRLAAVPAGTANGRTVGTVRKGSLVMPKRKPAP